MKVSRAGIMMKGLLTLMALGLVLSCNESNRDESPVELIATANQNVSVIDLAAPITDTSCAGGLGTIELRSIVKRLNATDTRFLDIQLKSYRVSYVRSDGGRVTPNSFVRTVSGLVSAGGAPAVLSTFFVLEDGAGSRAPFVALLPNNGGVDPETGQRFVRFDVTIEVFGETLAGQNVSARTSFPLTFCAACGGCR